MKKHYPVKNIVHMHLISGSIFIFILMLNFWKYSIATSIWLFPMPFAAYVFLEKKYTYIYAAYTAVIILVVNLSYNYFQLEFFKFSDEKYLIISDSFIVISNIITFLLLLYFNEKINKAKGITFLYDGNENTTTSLPLIKGDDYEKSSSIYLDTNIANVFSERSEATKGEKEYTQKEIEKYKLLFEKIIDYMEKEKPYKDINFTISQLATILKSNNLYISIAIKQNGYSSFNHFINTYRVNCVKQLIRENDLNKVTLMYIYTECGFANQSTFNRAFRQVEGITPSEYIKQLNNYRY